MRFRENRKGVYHIVTTVPPVFNAYQTRWPSINNPFVRQDAGKPQYLAWVAERSGGGRAFSFTGDHSHRKLGQ